MFSTNVAHADAIGKAHAEFFRDIRPASTLVEVSRLVHPDMLIEIEADAVIIERLCPNTDICFMTATELTRRIRHKELSCVEVMEAHLAQIERVNPKVNAIVTFLPERA